MIRHDLAADLNRSITVGSIRPQALSSRWCQWGLAVGGGLMALNIAAAPAAPKAPPVATTPAAATTSVGTVRRTEQAYQLPSVKLMGGDGKPQLISKLIDDGRPVVLTFFYSSCTTVCPVTSQVLTEFVQQLGPQATRVNVMSVSIDPDHDTVTRLADHARSGGLVGGFYTGDPSASEAVQRAFDAWRGDKMNHEPVIFLRGPKQKNWVRLDGLVSPQRLMTEFRQISPS